MNGAAKSKPTDDRLHPIRRSERGVEAFVRADRHSRTVRVLKFVLPVAAAILVTGFAGYSWLSSAKIGSASIETASIEGGSLVMANPELDGFTSDNLPYKMTAARARQAIGGGDVIELEGIRANVPVDQENWADISAESGTYDRQKNRLDIDSPVTLKTTSGIIARLQSAAVDIGASSLTTSKPVEVELEGTHIAADSFAATDGGKVFVFENRVRVTIDPSSVRQAANK